VVGGMVREKQKGKFRMRTEINQLIFLFCIIGKG
jgi:hypothetical protein